MTDQQVSAPTLGEAVIGMWPQGMCVGCNGANRHHRSSVCPVSILEASLYGISQPCETCGGKGFIGDAPLGSSRVVSVADCPACNGQGYRYTGGLVERMGEWLSGEGRYVTSAHYVTDQVRAHVLAALSAAIGPNPEGGET